MNTQIQIQLCTCIGVSGNLNQFWKTEVKVKKLYEFSKL